MELRHDIRFALRQLRLSPVFTTIAVATLALGIGANSAIFALVDATLLRPLPFDRPERLVSVFETSAATTRGLASPPNVTDWEARSRSFERIAGFVPGVGGMVMAGRDGRAETVPRQWVSAGIFDVLGVAPIAGRTFTADDDARRASVVVIGETLWRSRFDADPSIVGRDIRLDGTMWTVVGVVPEGFQLIAPSSMWAMRPSLNLPPGMRGARFLHAVGRLKPGVSIASAQADLSAVAAGLEGEFPRANTGRGVRLERLHASLIGGDLRTTAMLFLGVVCFVLLICCANVANLLLARATTRSRELAVRSALGAGRARIIGQLMTESLVLSLAGGALGLALGAGILRVAPSIIPSGLLPAAVTLAFDARVVGFCAAAAIGTGLLFGLLPAWRATRLSAVEAMGADNRTTVSGGGTLRALLVAGEVATAVLLLFGAGLLLRTLIAVQSFDRGYRADRVLTMMVDPLGSQYPTAERLQQFFDEIEAEIRAIPGVADVAWTSALPLDSFDAGAFSYEISGDPPLEADRRPATEYQVVSPTYFSTLDLPIVEGRAFDARDRRGGVRVAIVNEAFARSLRGRSPIGQRVAIRPVTSPGAEPRVLEIVGVARQVKGRPDEPAELVQIYAPMAQDLSDDVFLAVRPRSGRAEALAPAVRAAVGRVDREQLVSLRDVRTLDDIDRAATGRHRFRAVMVGAFAALALVLAMVGVFGILAYSVQQRARDFGVRRALGATSGDVVRLVMTSAARIVAGGAAVGLIAAAAAGRLVTTMLFGVEPLDVTTFSLVTAVIAAAAVLSVAGPAWRATRIDPATVLRGT
jgi:putative ABC transport system permease protein